MTRNVFFVLALGILLLFVVRGHPEVPHLMNYQGKLTDETGVPVSDGDYTIQFRIYAAPSGGSLLWEEQQTVPVVDGLFGVVLGDSTSIPDTVFTGATRWLALQVSPDPELTPRKPIVSVGYAFRALDADTAEYALSAPASPDNDWVISGDDIHHESGNVGIGTPTPGNRLHIVGSESVPLLNVEQSGSHRGIRVHTTNACALWVANAGNHGLRVTQAGGDGIHVENAGGHAGYFNGTGYFSGNVGIGTTIPDTSLHVVGNIRMVDGNQAAGYVLTSDANGVGSWQAGTGDSDWSITGNILHPAADYGLSMRQSNVMHGQHDSTHVNLGVACTTGMPTQDDRYCTIGGGSNNYAGYGATVSGGGYNAAGYYYPTVGGGYNNSASGQYATVAGGSGNITSNDYSSVVGGQLNTAGGSYSHVGGGNNNEASSLAATVAGGIGNYASGGVTTIGGGNNNTASGYWSTIAGGVSNTTGDTAATVAGGRNNRARGKYSFVGGGGGSVADSNSAIGESSVVGGGKRNTASGAITFVGGGAQNEVGGILSTVAGGYSNSTGADYATVGGGYDNTASGLRATVAGGYRNAATAGAATVAGGYADTVEGSYSFAAGYRVRLTPTADYTFAFGRDFSSGYSNAVIFHNSSTEINVGIGMTQPTAILHVAQNATTDPIADQWRTYSSKRWKSNIEPITEALEKVKRLTGVYYDWNETGEHDIGMIAEEVGEVIPEVVVYEENGKDAQSLDYARLVALLVEAVKEQQKEIEALKVEVNDLKTHR